MEEPIAPHRTDAGQHFLDGTKADAGYPITGDYVLMYWVRRAREAEGKLRDCPGCAA